jgi:CheY-like chemotaxis protein
MACIVFCEDDPTIQKLIRISLRATGHDIHIASDGAEGMMLIERLRPHLVFTDVSMPSMDGIQLCTALRAQTELAHIPIVIMTASGSRSDLNEVMRQDTLAVILKPFSTQDLRRMIERFLSNADSV